jgi:hypothetical protein
VPVRVRIALAVFITVAAQATLPAMLNVPLDSSADVPPICAVASTGGWLLSAPGTPDGVLLAPLFDSDICWLRTAAGAPPWLGLNSSSVTSLCAKSISAVMVARTLSRPTMPTTRLT